MYQYLYKLIKTLITALFVLLFLFIGSGSAKAESGDLLNIYDDFTSYTEQNPLTATTSFGFETNGNMKIDTIDTFKGIWNQDNTGDTTKFEEDNFDISTIENNIWTIEGTLLLKEPIENHYKRRFEIETGTYDKCVINLDPYGECSTLSIQKNFSQWGNDPLCISGSTAKFDIKISWDAKNEICEYKFGENTATSSERYTEENSTINFTSIIQTGDYNAGFTNLRVFNGLNYEEKEDEIDPTYTATSTGSTYEEEIDWDANRINWVEKAWEEYATTGTSTWEVNWGLEIDGQVTDYDKWDQLRIEFENSNGSSTGVTNIIGLENKIKSFDIYEDVTWNPLEWTFPSWDQVSEELTPAWGSNFYEFNTFLSFNSWEPDTYTATTYFYNSSTSESTSTQTWTINLSENFPSRTRDTWEEASEQSQLIKRLLKETGITSFITEWRKRFESRFPISWILEILEEYNELADTTSLCDTTDLVDCPSLTEPPELQWTLPAGINDQMGSTTLTLVDFKTAYTKYPDFFHTIRELLSYGIWLAIIGYIIFRTKSFFTNIMD